MSPGNPHLYQLDGCSEEHQSNALHWITVRITKPECRTSEKEYRQMLERSWEIRNDTIIGRNYRETHNAKDQDPGQNLRQAFHKQD